MELLKTIEVEDKAGNTVVINATDFDPAVHTRPEDKAAKARAAAQKAEDEAKKKAEDEAKKKAEDEAKKGGKK